jgi:hypothetical protein
MRVTVPLVVTDVMLISSTAVEPFAPAAYDAGTTYAFGDIVSVAADYSTYESLVPANTGHTPATSPAWWRLLGPTETVYNAGTAYGLGATASSSSTHRVYESLQAANTGNPFPVLPATSTAWWIDVGPTNKFAMFDLMRNTQTASTSALTVVVAPGQRINTLGILGMVADSITITATSGGATVYSYTESLIVREVLDHYMYAYEPFATQPSTVVFNVPPYSNLIYTITLTRSVGNIKCGSVVQGTYAYIGDTQYEAESDALNFSTIDRTLYGDAILVPRRSVPKTNQQLMLDKSKVNRVYALRTALNAVPALWTALDDASDGYFELLLILGVYKRFTINAKLPTNALVTLELEEI